MFGGRVSVRATLSLAVLLVAAAGGCKDAPRTPVATPVAPVVETAEPNGYVIVYTLEPRGGEKRTTRTYLLGRYAVAYDLNSKLDAVYDVQAESWIDAGGKRTTLDDAQAQFDNKRQQTEANLKSAPDTPYVRALKQALRPSFTVEKAGERVVLKSPSVTLEVVPAVTPLPKATADQVYALDRMMAYRNGREEVKGQPPYMLLALHEECKKRGIYPALIDMTIRAGGEPSGAQATISFGPLTADQHAHMTGLVQRVQALADARD
jgi:hypothetical protein